MLFRRWTLWGITLVAAYGLLLGVSAFAGDTPEPGSPGDTLTREDARMALLVYKLLDKDGKIKGAHIKNGKTLFMQNCRLIVNCRFR